MEQTEKNAALQEQTDDLMRHRQRLLYAAGKYSDYSSYHIALGELSERYDETLEIYNFHLWLDASHGTIREKAAEMLRVTEDIFYDLQKNAGKELYYTMTEITELDAETQKAICGFSIPKGCLSEERFEDILEEWTDYPCVQEEALEEFLRVLKNWVERAANATA